MSIEAWAVQSAASTSTGGTTDIAHGTVTTTPNAALHIVTSGTANGTGRDQGRISIGATDGTTQMYGACGSQNAQATSNTFYREEIDAHIALNFAGSSGEDGVQSHNSWIAGGERVNNDNGFANAYLIHSLFFAADNASVQVATISPTVDTGTNVDPGHVWDVVIAFGLPRSSGAQGSDAEIFLGFYDKTSQGCIMWNSADAQAAGAPSAMISTTYIAGEIALAAAGALDYGVLASLGAGNVLTITPKNAGGDSDEIGLLFLDTGGAGVKVLSWDSSTSTGSEAVTGAGGQPFAALNLHSFLGAYDSGEHNANAGSFGVSVWTADDQFCGSISDEYNSATTDTQGLGDNKAINLPLDTGAAGDEAAFTSFDADGFTLNYTAVEGTANKQLSLLLLEATTSVVPAIYSRMIQEF